MQAPAHEMLMCRDTLAHAEVACEGWRGFHPAQGLRSEKTPMKTPSLALAVALAATTLLAVAPAADAKPYCTYKDWSCDGFVCAGWNPTTNTWLTCVRDPIVCVTDPCWP